MFVPSMVSPPPSMGDIPARLRGQSVRCHALECAARIVGVVGTTSVVPVDVADLTVEMARAFEAYINGDA